jgi:hypothetical protein
MPTINESVATGADDGFIYTGLATGRFYTAASLRAGNFNGADYNYFSAIRFQTIPIPQGATINAATLGTSKFKANRGSPPVIKIFGNDIDDAPAWGTTNEVQNITKTTANSTVDTSSATASTDVAAIVQEIVNRGGWASNNDMAFGLFPQSNPAGVNLFYPAAYGGAGGPATLDITYTAGGGGGTAVPVFYHHLRQQGIA